MRTINRFKVLLGFSVALTGCADFAEGMQRGMASQQEYRDREADPFGAYLADLPMSPAKIKQLPAPEFYRCTGEGRSLDYAFYRGEWYHKGWREGEWTVLGCNQGNRRSVAFLSYASSTCGDNGRKFWNITTITSRDGFTISEAELDRKTLVYSTKYTFGGSTRHLRATCKQIEM
ncbi:hypothetical protein GJ699_25465 [Duganella sp. FT80W]|uniref:Uncharacterized protein n=1 Tax=Duganella guangzhouensis TaxID=2666084 RepID=A0A6I2L6R9_9BURK|nr:hypothetical protein [Duganella guangzhouensis]MRW93342.1 hypothetical protein [Duganella guangzhouensis]